MSIVVRWGLYFISLIEGEVWVRSLLILVLFDHEVRTIIPTRTTHQRFCLANAKIGRNF